MGKKSAIKKKELEFANAIEPIKAILSEEKEIAFKLVKNHKILSSCPCLDCFSADFSDYLDNKHGLFMSELLHNNLIDIISDEWDSL